MPHNFPVPDTEQLERLIFEVYDALHEPDMARLTRIEERLIRRLKTAGPRTSVNKLPWWIVLLLAGGFATAAWWTGEQWFKKSVPIPVEDHLKPADDIKGNVQGPDEPANKSKPDGQTEEQTSIEDNKSSVIYQRENF